MTIKRSVVPLVVILFLLVLAGCSTSVQPHTPTDTASPAPVPTHSPTPSPTPVLAPGMGPDSVRNVAALANAHRSVLDKQSYTERITEVRKYPNGTLADHMRIQRLVSENASRYHEMVADDSLDEQVMGNRSRIERYQEDGRIFVKVATPSGWRYGLERRAASRYPSKPFVLFTAVESQVGDQIPSGGVTMYRLEVNRTIDPVLISHPLRPSRYDKAWNVTLDALVTEEGFIRNYQLSYTLHPAELPTVKVTRRVSYGSVGNTTVNRPPWYQAGVANTTGR